MGTPKTVQRTCACGTVFTAREADVKRGWAKSCSKSCAAKRREKKTGNFKAYIERRNKREDREDAEPTFSNAQQFDNCEL